MIRAAVLLLPIVFTVSKAHWTYKGQKDHSEWVGECLTGKHQSPVEVTTKRAKNVNMDPLYFEFYDLPPKSDSLLNNGHSVTFRIQPIREINAPQVVGGGLPGVFQFEQLHFHWGSVDKRGSEHTIDGERYPMELHAVHFNTKYGASLKEALQNSGNAYDALAVLAVMFEIQEEDNPMLNPIVEELDHVHYTNQVTHNVTVFPLNNLLPHETSKFFRYNGSLTTPPCSEVVVWTIFEDPLLISERQMEKFRSLEDLPPSSSIHHHASDNFRSTQPLNGRKILLVNTRRAEVPPTMAAASAEANAAIERQAEVKEIVFYICVVVSVIGVIVIVVLLTLIVLYYARAPQGVRTLDERTGPNSYLPIRKAAPESSQTSP